MPTLNVMSLNMWGLAISKHKDERMTALGTFLETTDLDIVGLQEIWEADDAERLIDRGKKGGLEFAHYYQHGIIGSGLLLLSRYPIIKLDFRRFRISAAPESLNKGEVFAAKGIGFARIATPNGNVDVYNTHLVAQYNPDDSDEQRVYRYIHAYEAAAQMNQLSTENPIIALGDFNMRPHHFTYKMMTALVGLTDTFAALHPDDTGYTFTATNPYTGSEPSQRLDYIFIRDGKTCGLKTTHAEITMLSRPERPTYPYSDHYGVRTTLEFTDSTRQPDPDFTPVPILTELADTIEDGIFDAEVRRTIDGGKFAMAAAGLYYIAKDLKRPRWLKWSLIVLLLFRSLHKGIYSRLLLPGEINTLNAVLNELRTEIAGHEEIH